MGKEMRKHLHGLNGGSYDYSLIVLILCTNRGQKIQQTIYLDILQQVVRENRRQ